MVFRACHGETCKCLSYITSGNELTDENKISSIAFEYEDAKCDEDGKTKCNEFCKEMVRFFVSFLPTFLFNNFFFYLKELQRELLRVTDFNELCILHSSH